MPFRVKITMFKSKAKEIDFQLIIRWSTFTRNCKIWRWIKKFINLLIKNQLSIKLKEVEFRVKLGTTRISRIIWGLRIFKRKGTRQTNISIHGSRLLNCIACLWKLVRKCWRTILMNPLFIEGIWFATSYLIVNKNIMTVDIHGFENVFEYIDKKHIEGIIDGSKMIRNIHLV